MAWNDAPDVLTADDDVYSPSLKRRANIDVFSPNVESSTTPDEAGHYQSNTSRSNFHYATAAANAYKPSVSGGGSGEAPENISASPVNPYTARLTDLGNQLQSAYAAPPAGTARQVIGALFSRRNPQLGGLISGETQRARQIEPL